MFRFLSVSVGPVRMGASLGSLLAFCLFRFSLFLAAAEESDSESEVGGEGGWRLLADFSAFLGGAGGFSEAGSFELPSLLGPCGGSELGGEAGSVEADFVGVPELLLGSVSEFPPELPSESPSELPPELEGEDESEDSGFPNAAACGTSEVVTEL